MNMFVKFYLKILNYWKNFQKTLRINNYLTRCTLKSS